MVDYAAQLARIALDEGEKKQIASEIDAIIEYAEVLKKIDTSNIEPLSHVFAVTNALRADEVVSFEEVDRDLLLSNAPAKQNGAFVVPKTVE